MEYYSEKEFYQENGGPAESLYYCDYVFYIDHMTEFGPDYDQFALVMNAMYPYIRLTKKRGQFHFPCGGSSIIASDGSFAKKTDAERDMECPKIAWGFAAVFLANIRYDSQQKDYVLEKDPNILYDEYYKKYWDIYKSSHNGLRLSNILEEQKELDFIEEHIEVIRGFWVKSEPLKKYLDLYKYASDIEKQYEEFLQRHKQLIESKLMVRNNIFSTEIRVPFENKPCIKVFFLDDSVAPSAKAVVETLNCVMTVNITESKSKAHPGNTLTVYPKPMVDAKLCEKEVIDGLNCFFSNVTVGNMQPHNEAYFAGIEKQILETLDKALSSVIVCVAWFTNPKLKDKLLEKQAEGIDVKVIIYKDGVNHSRGVDLSELNYKEYRGERGGIMHEKFCVIDNVHTICGSYNWTLNAENKNDEDAAFHLEDYKFASKYTKRFNELWKRDGVIG